MKEITKKILEAGLIDKTMAQLLERWHLLTPEEAALATKPIAVQEALEKFVENLEDLLHQEADLDTAPTYKTVTRLLEHWRPLTDEFNDKPLRETRLEIWVNNPPVQYTHYTVHQKSDFPGLLR